jgi:lauroyl/myristoyl acyltransferase
MEYLSDKSSVARMDKNLEKISPFELKNRLIEMADESVKKMAHVMLNAGRGNPNWIATEAREAFFVQLITGWIAWIDNKQGFVFRVSQFIDIFHFVLPGMKPFFI